MRADPRALALSLLFALSALLALGCGVERRTQVMLEIDATCEVRALAQDLEVVVEGQGTMSMESFGVGPSSGWPRRIALIPRGGDATRGFRVTVTAKNGGLVVASSHVIGGYEAERTLGLRVILADGCQSCAESMQACVGGACGDAVQAMLPAWEPGTPACAQPLDAGGLDAGGLDAGPDGGRDGGPDAAIDGGLLEVDFCRELVIATCEGRLRCCDAASGETLEDCRAANEGRCQALLSPLTGRTDIFFDPVVAAAALAEVRATAMDCDLAIPDLLLTPSGVLRAWDGALASGADCAQTANPLVNDALCAGDASCRPTGVGRRACAARVGEGMACRDWLDCTEGLYCPGGRAGADGACAPRLADGQPCAAYYECASLSCVDRVCQMRTRNAVYCANPYP